MSQPAVQLRPHNARTRSLIVPREHGAWGMLLVPLATGAIVGLQAGNRVVPLILFVVAALALFWLRTPVESLLGTAAMRAQTPAERRAAVTAIIPLSVVALATLVALFWHGANLGLAAIGAAAALAFGLQAAVKQLGRGARMTSQLIGAIGLTCTAPAAYYVAAGRLDLVALGLWLANWIFAGNQIHYVQVRIHRSRVRGWREKFAWARGFLFGQLLMMAALVLAYRLTLIRGLALLAFVPVLFRGFGWFFRAPGPLNVRRLGLAELAHAIAFGLLLALAFTF